MPASDTPGSATAPYLTTPRTGPDDAPASAAVLDAHLFRAPYVLVARDNAGIGTVATLGEARHALATDPECVTLVGTAVPGIWFVDVDPADGHAPPEAGQATAEQLVHWCEQHGLPWLLRASGRPGGRHLAVALPEALLPEFRGLAHQLTQHHGAPGTVRKTLRLLDAPHRHGHPAPILAGTLRPADVPRQRTDQPHQPADPTTAPTPPRRTRRNRTTAAPSRSEREFGDACAAARAGWSATRAWTQANTAGSKARELGELGWRRWVWCMAVTVVAAEHHLTEPEAWQRFRTASPARARALGIVGWREQYWKPALAEAERARPRRRRTSTAKPSASNPRPADHPPAAVPASAPVTPAANDPAAETAILSAGLRAAAELPLANEQRRPQFANSVAAALHALAEQIARRAGSLSVRDWAEAARLDTKTVRRARDWAAERGLIVRVHDYAGGATDTDAWQPGPAAEQQIAHVRDTAQQETSPTRLETPIPHGRAQPSALKARHQRDRTRWVLRCKLSAITEATGESYAESNHPAARTLRSLWHQRCWWQSLTPEQQDQRRAARRERLAQLHHSRRAAWFDWLNQRSSIVAAAERMYVGAAVPSDHQVLTSAPDLVHLGLRAQAWLGNGSSTCAQGHLQFRVRQLAS